MKKISLILVLFITVSVGAFADFPSASLLWISGDFGWDGSSLGGGATLDSGFLVTKNLYFSLEQMFFLADTTNLFLGGGLRFYPFENGFVTGIDVGAGDIQTHGVDAWSFASSALVGYDFGFLVLGTKARVNFASTFQTTLEVFVGLSRRDAPTGK